jgi:hypothetical protein
MLGTIDIPRHVNEERGERVVVRSKEKIETADGRKYNAIEVLVCRMKMDKREYWALETNLPLLFVMKLEGFTPKLERPSLAQMHYLNLNQHD